jgi:hypothetical protein
VLSRFLKNAGKWLSCGIEVRLWRRTHFCIGQSDSFSGMASGDVCDGDHWLDVMNPENPALRFAIGRATGRFPHSSQNRA